VKRWPRGFSYAASGILHAVRTERNMRFHVAAAALVVAFGTFSRLKTGEWLWVLLAITLVWSAECLNTAIERVVDLTSGNDLFPLAKAAKDAAAGAVLITACYAVAVAALVLLPAFLERLKSIIS
jgi:undecaprenol kinase